MTPLAIARRLVGRYGLSVIPVRIDSKKPALPSWREYQHRRPTDRELVAWFSGPRRNVAGVTGPISGIVVIDLDSPAAREWAQASLPPTPMRVVTGSGGEHWYFRLGEVVVGNKVRIRDGIDVRGKGGYVIAPGSIHPLTGRQYRAPEPWPASLDDVPLFDPAWIAEREPRVMASRPRRIAAGAPVLERARRYLAAVPPAIEGQGGDTHTFMVACRLVRGFDLDDDEVLMLLREWNQRCVPPWSEGELEAKVRHARRYGHEEFGGRCA